MQAFGTCGFRLPPHVYVTLVVTFVVRVEEVFELADVGADLLHHGRFEVALESGQRLVARTAAVDGRLAVRVGLFGWLGGRLLGKIRTDAACSCANHLTKIGELNRTANMDTTSRCWLDSAKESALWPPLVLNRVLAPAASNA